MPSRTPAPSPTWTSRPSCRPSRRVPTRTSSASSRAPSSRPGTLGPTVHSWPSKRYARPVLCAQDLRRPLTSAQLTGLCPFMKETSKEWLRPLHIHQTKDRRKDAEERDLRFREPDLALEALLPS